MAESYGRDLGAGECPVPGRKDARGRAQGTRGHIGHAMLRRAMSCWGVPALLISASEPAYLYPKLKGCSRSWSGRCPMAPLPSEGLGGGRTRCYGVTEAMPGSGGTARAGRQQQEGGGETGAGPGSHHSASGQVEGCEFPSHGSTRVSLFLSLFLPLARDVCGGSSLVAGDVPAWPWASCQTMPQFPHATEQ